MANPGEESGVKKAGSAVGPEDGVTIIGGKDGDDKAAVVGVSGPEGDLLKVQIEHGHLLKEILICQKKIVFHLETLTEVEIEDHNVEE